MVVNMSATYLVYGNDLYFTNGIRELIREIDTTGDHAVNVSHDNEHLFRQARAMNWSFLICCIERWDSNSVLMLKFIDSISYILSSRRKIIFILNGERSSAPKNILRWYGDVLLKCDLDVDYVYQLLSEFADNSYGMNKINNQHHIAKPTFYEMNVFHGLAKNKNVSFVASQLKVTPQKIYAIRRGVYKKLDIKCHYSEGFFIKPDALTSFFSLSCFK